MRRHLTLFAMAAVSAVAAPPWCSITEYGAAAGGRTNNAAAIQKAVDACADAGGGTVHVPPGEFLSGNFVLKSNITLHLAPGARLIASPHIEDHPTRFFIHARDADNVSIEGAGEINGNGETFFDKHTERFFRVRGARFTLIAFVRSRNVRVTGVRLRNAPAWTLHLLGCDGVQVRGISMISHMRGPNTDGIDIDSSRNVSISDSYIEGADDCIVVKTTGRTEKLGDPSPGGKIPPSENITVTNCTLTSSSNCLKLGTESLGDFRNIAFSNCALYKVSGNFQPPISGLAIEMVDGATLDGIVASNITMRDVATPIFVRLGNRGRGMRTPTPGQLRNVAISNIVATGAVRASSITGLPGHPARHISLDNINITTYGGERDPRGLDVPEHPDRYPEATMFGTLPAYGLYSRHVEGLTLRNLQVRWSEPDARPALIFDDVRQLDLDGFKTDTVSGGEPVVRLHNVAGALIRGSRVPAAAREFARTTGPASRDVRITGDNAVPAPRAAVAAPGEVAIVVQPGEPRFVQRAAEDLRAQLRARLRKPPLSAASLDQAPARAGVVLIGKAAELELARLKIPIPRDLGPEGYVIRSLEQRLGRPSVAAFGEDPHGTNYAVLDLAFRVSTARGVLPPGLDLVERPRYALRGMYAHQHWQYNHPYALRSWSLEDWKRYIDILAQFRFNLLQIWSMAGIVPDPPGKEDAAYLERYREIIRYASEERGMRQVWIGDCVNNISTSAHGMPIERREYFVVEELRNPGDPAGLRDILSNRRNLYRAAPNADGYWILDSDPGGWKGSPAGDFVNVFLGNRKLMEQHANPAAKLIYWMWWGWGTGKPAENIRDAVGQLQQRLPGEFWTLACDQGHLNIARDFKRLDRTVFFPYNAIEQEPSPPVTQVKFAGIRERFRLLADYPETAGVMGNAQTPLMQLPNIAYFGELAWKPERGARPDRETLRDIAARFFPEAADELAEAWYQLEEIEPAAARAAAAALDSLRERKGMAAGVAGRSLFPDGRVLTEDLPITLRMHAAALESLSRIRPGASGVAKSLGAYLLEALQLQRRHGFHVAPMRDGRDWLPELAWYLSGPDYEALRTAWRTYSAREPRSAAAALAELEQALGSSKYDPKVYGRMLDFLLGRARANQDSQ